MVWLQSGGCTLQLIEYSAGGGQQLELRHNKPGNPHFCFYVNDVDATYKKLKALGNVRITSEIHQVAPTVRSFYVCESGRCTGRIPRAGRCVTSFRMFPEVAKCERPRLSAGRVTASTGIDEAMIATLVERFYAAAQQDPLLGPVFAQVRDWDAHVARITDFWSSVVLMSGRYHGDPLATHPPFPPGEAHFARWRALLGETATATCPPAAAQRLILLAQRIAASLSRALATPHRFDESIR